MWSGRNGSNQALVPYIRAEAMATKNSAQRFRPRVSCGPIMGLSVRVEHYRNITTITSRFSVSRSPAVTFRAGAGLRHPLTQQGLALSTELLRQWSAHNS